MYGLQYLNDYLKRMNPSDDDGFRQIVRPQQHAVSACAALPRSQ